MLSSGGGLQEPNKLKSNMYREAEKEEEEK